MLTALSRTMLRDLTAHRARMLMMLLAIAVGSMAAVASWVASDSTARSIGGTNTRSGDVVAVRATSDARLTGPQLARLDALPGVDAATGIHAGRAGVVGPDGKLLPTDTRIDQAGTGWDDTGRFQLVDGTAPQAPGDVAVDRGVAGTGVRPGSTVTVLVEGAVYPARVSGVYAYHPLGRSSGDMADPTPALALSGVDAGRLGDTFTSAELRGGDPTAVAALARQALGGGDAFAVRTGPDLAADALRQADEDTSDLRETVLPFAGVALLVGAFLIANTFTMLVTQRGRQFALLRAVGARRHQIRRTVLTEAAVLGVVGGTAGVLGGIGLGPALVLLMKPGREIDFTVTPVAVLIGYVVAVVVTMAAAFGAARRAGRVTPLAALRTDPTPEPGRRRGGPIAGAVLLGLALVTIVATGGPSEATTPRILALGAIVVGVLGVLLLGPWLSARLLRPVAALVTRHGGPGARIGVRGATRDPRRTAATVNAVAIGLGLVCAFSTLLASLTDMVGSTTLATIPPTTTVVTSSAHGSTLATADLDAARRAPGVTAVAAEVNQIVDVDTPDGASSRRAVTGIDPAAMSTVLSPPVTAGDADLTHGVLFARNEADMLGLGVGSPVTLRLPGHPLTTRVAGLYEATEASAGVYYDTRLAPPGPGEGIDTIYATGSDAVAARNGIEASFAQRPDVVVTDASGVAGQAVARQQVGFALIISMFGIAVLIALFGVVNSLVLSVLERTTEIGVLRALGAGARLVQRTVRVESVVLAAFGCLIGTGMGVGGGAVMQHAMLGRAIGDVSVPWTTVGLGIVGMLVAAVLAAAWPAHLATRTRPLDAIAAR